MLKRLQFSGNRESRVEMEQCRSLSGEGQKGLLGLERDMLTSEAMYTPPSISSRVWTQDSLQIAKSSVLDCLEQ